MTGVAKLWPAIIYWPDLKGTYLCFKHYNFTFFPHSVVARTLYFEKNVFFFDIVTIRSIVFRDIRVSV